jgi:putative hydrolase of the HAD superfamily
LNDFSHIDTWIFDLDNTLYEPSTNLFGLIDQRMSLYIASLTGLDGLSARALQKYYYRRFGTTMRGLMDVDGVEPLDFLAFVHDISHDRLTPSLAMATAITRLPGRRFILTNGSRHHALGVAKSLKIDHLFNDVFDIIEAEFHPKPHPQPYEKFVAKFGIDPHKAVMFEDLAINLKVPKTLGMMTVLVQAGKGDVDERMTHADDGVQGEHVDYATQDLVSFLNAMTLATLPVM